MKVLYNTHMTRRSILSLVLLIVIGTQVSSSAEQWPSDTVHEHHDDASTSEDWIVSEHGWTKQCDFDRLTDLTIEEFYRDYFQKKPVVITSVLGDWPAVHNWKKSTFLQKYGESSMHHPFTAVHTVGEFVTDKEPRSPDIGDFLHRGHHQPPPAHLYNDKDGSKGGRKEKIYLRADPDPPSQNGDADGPVEGIFIHPDDPHPRGGPSAPVPDNHHTYTYPHPQMAHSRDGGEGSGSGNDEGSDNVKLFGKMPRLYVFDSDLLRRNPELKNDFSAPKYFANWTNPGVYFLLGKAHSGVAFHSHTDAWNALVHGHKRWFMYPPKNPGSRDFTRLQQENQEHWFQYHYPKLDPRPMECVQGPGELFYIPEGWQHATLSLGESIGVAAQLDLAEHYHRDMGMMFLLGDRVDEAVPHLKALMTAEQSAGIHTTTLTLAKAYLKQKRYRPAMRLLREAVLHDDSCSKCQLLYGRALLGMRKFDRALKALEKAIQHEHSADAYYYLSLARTMLNQPLPDIMDSLRFTLMLEPKHRGGRALLKKLSKTRKKEYEQQRKSNIDTNSPKIDL